MEMSAFIAFIPILLIRFVLLGVVNKAALPRAALFAPLEGKEKIAYWIYQITTLLIVVALVFLKIRTDSEGFLIGAAVYGLGLVLYGKATADFAQPKTNGINVSGLYRISRNPMYVAYFICLLGCALMSGSWILFALLALFQIASHWIILSEERWCIREFGEEYVRYMRQVRRYI